MLSFIDTENTWNDPLVFYTQYTLLAISPIILIVLMYIRPAGYGRVSEDVNKNATMVNDKWLWCGHMIEVPVGIVSIFYYINNNENYSKTNIILLAMFMAHYLVRGYIYPFFVREIYKQHKTSLLAAVSAIIFIICNTIIQTKSTLFNAYYPDGYLTSYRFLFGLCVFIIGMRINLHSDYYLMELKNENKGYVIPYGYL